MNLGRSLQPPYYFCQNVGAKNQDKNGCQTNGIRGVC